MESTSKINWFPGHMKKATEAIELVKKDVDVILEIVDARGISISTNYDLRHVLQNKPLLQIALKADLADLNKLDISGVTLLSKFEKNASNKILKELDKITLEKTAKLKAKGLLIPHYNVIVIGLPNVGKSTIINVLAKRIKSKAENRPGVTKTVTWIKLNNKFSLLDTPGILFKKINDFATGAKLTLMGIIKPEVVPLNEILMWGFTYLKTFYFSQLQSFYHFSENLDYEAFLIHLAKSRKFVLLKNNFDLDRAQKSFFSDVINGKICKINYEKN